MATPISFYQILLGTDPNQLQYLWTGEPVLDDPVEGRVHGLLQLGRYIQATRERWLASGARVRPVDSVVDERRAMEEILLQISVDGEDVGLPVAIVGDRDPASQESNRFQSIRIYHSTMPLQGAHQIRKAPLPPAPVSIQSPAVRAYLDAMAEGDVERVLAQFEFDASFREPSSDDLVYLGTESLRGCYRVLFSNGGGLPLKHCTVTEDDRLTVVEWVLDRWGRTPIPPQPGLTVHERSRGGKIQAVRVYDDIDAPLNSPDSP